MKPEERAQFDELLGELFGAYDKPLTEAKLDGFWRGLERMSLPELVRSRDLMIADLSDGERRKSLGVSDVWAAHRRLRASAPTTPVDDGWRGDMWDIVANRHLLVYILRRMAAGQSGLNPQQTKVFVAYKNAWAADMRDEGGEEVDSKFQRGQWEACMARAQAEAGL